MYMAIVYVNLHPKYNYSNIVIDGYIEELKDYVKDVDWLNWDYASLRGRKPIVFVMGGYVTDEKSIELHLEYVKVILQRLYLIGIEIYIRDERWNDWDLYLPSKFFTEDEMYHKEIKLIKEKEEEKWVKENIKKYQNLIQFSIEKEKEVDSLLNDLLNSELEKYEEIKKKEEERKERLKNVWK